MPFRFLICAALLCCGHIVAIHAAEPDDAWRVVSQRMILPEAAHTLQQRWQQAGLQPILFSRRESIEMHVFDDPATYAGLAEARKAQAHWQTLGIEADIYPSKEEPGHYHIGLGRYYLREYALAYQKQLEKTGQQFEYRRMHKVIPVYRLTFPPTGRREAERLWHMLHRMGQGNPVLMPEAVFQQSPTTAADVSQTPISSAKRSNR